MAYYQRDIANLLNTVNTNIITLGNSLYKSVLLGSTNSNDKRNLRILSIGRELLSNQITLAYKPTFLYKFTILDATLPVYITISTDGTVGNTLEAVGLNVTEANLTKQQSAEELARQFKDVSYDFSPITSSDIETIVIDDAIYIYSNSPYFTSNVEITLSDANAISITSYLDNSAALINTINNSGSIDSLIPNIIDITNEYKDREDFNKDNPSPYSFKNVQLLVESTAVSTSTGTNTVSGHNQNTDSYLAKNTANQVSASELRIHLDNTDIHLTQAQITTLINSLIAAIEVQMSDLTDVTVSGIADDYILQYKTATSKWTAVAMSGAGASTLGDLTDVDDSSKANSYILRFNSSSGNWEAEAFPSIPQSLSALDDVNTAGAVIGQKLEFNGTTWTPVDLSLSDITDVDLTGVADDTFLKYDSGTSKYKVFSVSNPTLVTPTIYGDISGSNIWTVYQNDGTTPLSLLSGALTNQSITVDVGAKVEASAYFKYPVVGAGFKGPDSISGNFGTTDPGENTNSTSKTHTDLEGGVITSSSTTTKSYSVTLAGAKQGLQVSGANVVVATGNDTTSDTISVVFRHRIYFGVSSNTSLTEAQIKALGTSRFGDNTESFTGVSAGVGEYLYFIYDDQYSDLSNIILDGASPILGAFTKLTDVPITNPAGVAQNLKVYRSNAPNAFSNNSLNFS